MWMEVYW